MRDPARIETILAAVKSLWEKHPDLRLGQLVVIAAGPKEPCPEIFYIEDQVLVDRLESKLPAH